MGQLSGKPFAETLGHTVQSLLSTFRGGTFRLCKRPLGLQIRDRIVLKADKLSLSSIRRHGPPLRVGDPHPREFDRLLARYHALGRRSGPEHTSLAPVGLFDHLVGAGEQLWRHFEA